MLIRSTWGRSNPIWLSNVNCGASDKVFSQCQHDGWGKHSCSHYDDIYLNCDAGTSGNIKEKLLNNWIKAKFI